MVNTPDNEITRLLESWGDGSQAAWDQLMPLVYQQLKKMAKNYMNSQPSRHTLQTTALIHEAYLKLADHGANGWQNRAHFFAVAGQAMRHILVDHARRQKSVKHGGQTQILPLDEVAELSVERATELIDLDEALNRLEQLDARKSRVVELRYFAGLSIEETAEVLKISIVTANRDWRLAKSWLLRELSNQ